MHPIIENNRAAIDSVCRYYNVRQLEVCGSIITGPFDPDTSDVDFIVSFNSIRNGSTRDQYFGLLETFEVIFQRRVDLFMASVIEHADYTQARASRTLVFPPQSWLQNVK